MVPGSGAGDRRAMRRTTKKLDETVVHARGSE